MSTVKARWIKDLQIVGNANHENVNFDNRYKDHTELEGSAPTDVFLLSIIGCSTMASVAVLNKTGIAFGGVDTEIEAETQSSIDNPYHFTRFRIKYNFSKVNEEDCAKLKEAVKLSHNKYCPMVFMVEKIAPVQYEIYIDDTLAFKSENWESKALPICDNEICDNYYKA